MTSEQMVQAAMELTTEQRFQLFGLVFAAVMLGFLIGWDARRRKWPWQ